MTAASDGQQTFVPKKSTPGVFTDDLKTKFLELYSRGGTVNACAAEVGVSSVTVYAHVRKDEEFAERFRLAQETNTDELEDILHSLARAGNIAAIFGTLKARRPERWRDSSKVDITSGGKPLTALATALEFVATQREESITEEQTH